MKKLCKRAGAAILAAVMILSASLGLPSASAAGGEGVRVLDITDKDMWDGDGVSVVQRSVNGNTAVLLSLDDESENMSFFADFSPISVEDCSELHFDMILRGGANSYKISVTLGSGYYRSEAYTVGSLGDTDTVYVPLPDGLRGSLDHIGIDIEAVDGTVSYAIIHSASADDGFTYKYRETFMAESVECTLGSAQYTQEGVTVTPERAGAEISPDFITDTSDDAVYLAWITAKVSSAGTVEAAADTGDGITAVVSGTQALMQGSHTYSFIVNGSFERIRFVFQGITDGSVTAVGAGAVYLSEKYDSAVGSVESCKYEDGAVTVSGSLSTEAAVEYVGCNIGLYIIPVWADADKILEGEPDIVTGYSTRFSLTCTPEESYACCTYQAVLMTDEENIPLGAPRFAEAQTVSAEPASSVSALYGADAAGVFESNVSSTVIDIYTDRLLEDGDLYSAGLYTYGGEYFYLNNGYISEFENRLTFAGAAGIRVYARILQSENTELDFDPGNRDSVIKMCAVADILSTKLGGIRGFIIGNSVNTVPGAQVPDMTAAQNYAKLVSMFTLCVRSTGAAQEVFLPFTDSPDSDPSPCFAAVRHLAAVSGKQGISVLYSCEGSDPVSTAASAAHSAGVSGSFGYATDSCAAIWQAPEDSDYDELGTAYVEYCKAAATSGLRFAAISVSALDDPNRFYDILKSAIDREKVFSASVSQYKAIAENIAFEGTCDIWNFTNAYDTSGWVSGGSFSAAQSAGLAGGGRALTVASDPTDSGAGIIVCRLASPVNMADLSVRFTMSVSDIPSGGAVDITLVLGGGDYRAEFSAIAENSDMTEYVCNMSQFAGASKTEYAAIIVKGAEGASLNLSKVELCSLSAERHELEARLNGGTQSSADPLFYVFIIVLAAVTVIVFTLLSRRKNTRRVSDRKRPK